MFFKNQVSRRRFILQFAGISGLAMLGARDAYSQAGSRLDWARTSTGIRVVGTVNPVDSAWAFQRSPDGASWITLEEEGVVIGSGRIRWDIPISTNEPAGLFRLKLITVLRIGSRNYRIEANNQTLFAAMEILRVRVSDPSLFVSEYRTEPEGQFVTETNGVKGKWVFEVNRQKILDTGSSRYVPKLGDRIEWKLIL
ncbi:hypothetical protein A2643_03600 [Candidatus Nomurabacteria bacterium RIFCSPHIGHO2_01_FULL_39_220]|uniref:Uncharacterized protein n=1 Tax=Candidatus Nomurabacteria bacterium RIFCSPLOWO2_02_FULL_40_67 TaxID=1801787 RepID=A0A1F6Y3A2_9BACT|nr:MAG: hypothetical protein UU01_C0017G0001 [Parcubacteria group bacterium GW2011_GWA2_40_37]KKS11355.1 MAG: hypothetical protein UU66_C0020G0016 [Parcubacteria group bacterium GW2011_GWB1_41_5]KKS70630.1 MAG: hypothetical protein UV43_C0057G0001 [Parcubacteria group bacterium GW2011_GWF2_42_7]OGI62491.1 MAG: hypothetical protein A2W12_01080 [Candidatus Nomurabacteria bacterium RBG_16_40_11]OGI69455.1 MAG: hypothetical protein A2643_03600 [Candidatus Nomurabacteria bacterium RIFCSPHIGHO2_01_FU